VIGQGIPNKPRVPNAIRIDRRQAIKIVKRRAYFGPVNGWRNVPIYGRADLKIKRKGPCVIEEYDATCIVPIGATACLDQFGNLLMELE
jgi:N-methylhydantoinase A